MAASDERTIIVASDGTGDATTITAGLGLAEPGDRVLVKWGTYAERLVVHKPIDLTGDPEAIIVFDEDSPVVELPDGRSLPNGILVRDADARLTFLTVRGPAAGVGVQVEGGSPTLNNVSVELAGDRSTPDRFGMRLTDGTAADWRYSDLDGDVLVDGGATPTIFGIGVEGRLLATGAGTDPTVQSATLGAAEIGDGALASVIGGRIDGTIVVRDTGSPVISRNLVKGDNGATGVVIRNASPRIEGNRIRGFGIGIEVGPGAGPRIEANDLQDNGTGIAVRGAAAAVDAGLVIQGNRFCGNQTDLAAPAGTALTLPGNEVCAFESAVP
jgi:nitrous oxidase accessory protein NosD